MKAEELTKAKEGTEKEDGISEQRNRVTVVIPTLNEEEAIGRLIEEVKKAGYNRILVVDAYSQDRTAEIVNGFEDVKLLHQFGRGKAGALQTAFQQSESPFLVVLDGDGSYDPSDIDRFLTPLQKFDFVKGERQAKSTMSRLHRLGNFIITKTFNILFGTDIPDVCSGFYAIRADVAGTLNFEKHPLTVEQEMLAQLISSGHKITSVPVKYRKRSGGVSKVRTWRQGFRDLITNFDLARTHGPILLFSFLAMLAVVPALFFLMYALLLFVINGNFHGGYVLAGLSFLVLGAQGFTVATIASMLRRMERRLSRS